MTEVFTVYINSTLCFSIHLLTDTWVAISFPIVHSAISLWAYQHLHIAPLRGTARGGVAGATRHAELNVLRKAAAPIHRL